MHLTRPSRSIVQLFPLRIVLLFALQLPSLAQNPAVPTLLREAQAALDAGDFGVAIRDFQQAQQLSPDSLEAARGLLLSYLQAGRFAEAENSGKISVARWSKDAELQHLLGLVYFKQGRNDLALPLLQAAESLNP